MRVLTVGIGAEVPQRIVLMLRQNGLAVDVCHQGDLPALAKQGVCDVIVAFLGSRERRPADLIRSLRRLGCTAPLIAVNASVDLAERVEALDSGADDSVPPTVGEPELLARIRALLRRPPVSVGPTYSFGDLVLDAATSIVTCRGQRIVMPPRAIALLEVLMRAGDATVSRERLDNALFSFEHAVTPNALEAAISRLRHRLRSVGSVCMVAADRGFGYHLEVAERPPAAEVHDSEPKLATALYGGSKVPSFAGPSLD